MRFGGQRPPGRLLVARSLVYLEAGVLLIWDAWSLLFTLSGGGTQAGLSLSGLVDRQELSGAGLLMVAVLQLLIAGALVYLDREASAAPLAHRRTMSAVQVAYAAYMVGFLSSAVGDWIFGPLLAAAVIALHWWPELDRALLGSYPAVATPAEEATATTANPAPPVAQGFLPPTAPPPPLSGPDPDVRESSAQPEVPTAASARATDGLRR